MKPVLQFMRAINFLFVLAVGHMCLAGAETNIIAVTDWSQPISLQNEHLHDEAIRGRLLILQGMEPAYGGPETTNGAMTFIELQNVTGACCDSIDVYFAVTNLHCQLSDATGKAVPKPLGGAWGGRGPLSPCWVQLPYNSTIRLFVNGGRLDPLTVYPGGEPWGWWSIGKEGTNAYYLAGTLSLSTHTTSSLPPEHHNATLVFPRTKIAQGRVGEAK